MGLKPLNSLVSLLDKVKEVPKLIIIIDIIVLKGIILKECIVSDIIIKLEYYLVKVWLKLVIAILDKYILEVKIIIDIEALS